MTSSAYQDLLKTQKEILELGMYCKKFNITKAELQDLASKKRYEEEKEEHDSYEDAKATLYCYHKIMERKEV